MEYLASNTLPLLFIGGTVAAYAAYQSGACSKKAKKAAKSKSNGVVEEDWMKPKEKKVKNKSEKKDTTKVAAQIYKPIEDEESEPEEKPVQKPESKMAKKIAAATKKLEKPAAKPAVVEKPAPKPVEKPVAKPVEVIDEKQAEIERLKKLLAQAEAKADKKKAEKAPVVVDEVYNPTPMLTKEALEAQRAEEARLSAEFASQWQEVKVTRKPKTKKTTEEEAAKKEEPLVAKTYLEAFVPVDKRGMIMGKGAETLKQIMEISGAKIEMPKQGTSSTKVIIEGTREQAEAAKQIINDLVNKSFSSALTPELTEGRVRVEADKRAIVLGTKGANIQKIMEETGVKVNFPERGSTSDSVQIIGDAHGVAIAKGAIRSLIKEGFSPITHKDWMKITVPFPQAYRKNLIGTKGSVIKSIQNNTGCKINFPDTEEDVVIVVGPAGKVYAAATQISNIQEKLDAPVEDVFVEGFDDETGLYEEEEW